MSTYKPRVAYVIQQPKKQRPHLHDHSTFGLIRQKQSLQPCRKHHAVAAGTWVRLANVGHPDSFHLYPHFEQIRQVHLTCINSVSCPWMNISERVIFRGVLHQAKTQNGDDLDDQSSKVFIHEKWKTLPPALLQQRASSLKTSWSLVHSLYILLFVWFLWFVDRVSLSCIISTYTGPTSYCP